MRTAQAREAPASNARAGEVFGAGSERGQGRCAEGPGTISEGGGENPGIHEAETGGCKEGCPGAYRYASHISFL